MTNNQERINQLFKQLNTLEERHEDVAREMYLLRKELNQLKAEETAIAPTEPEETVLVEKTETPKVKVVATTEEKAEEQPSLSKKKAKKPPKKAPSFAFQANLEKFIGENLINKIGILIIVIGVGIGAKYAIDNEMISPLTRIILGYLMGIGLMGFAIKLKAKYKNFSAVLLSGAMAIMYFITFAAYDFYGLIPQEIAFGLMLIFTVFTVVAAIHYDKQVIAHIGLVGAYAVPFLLSDGSGKIIVLFTYMAIINAGILVISFKKHWKPLYYVAFLFTWLIYSGWYFNKYDIEEHFALGFIFLLIFFVTFYVTSLAYKVIEKEKFKIDDIILLLANSFVFYGFGFTSLQEHEYGAELLGIFTLANAMIHFAVSAVVYYQKLADKNLLHFISGMVLVFITITIPVQLEGSWVAMLWALEAALVFWIGRTKKVAVYEALAYPLMVLAFFGVLAYWNDAYPTYNLDTPETKITPLLNIHFLTSLIVLASFGFINILNHNKSYTSFIKSKEVLNGLSNLALTILLIATYSAFKIEIETYWKQLYIDSALTINVEGSDYPNYYHNHDLQTMQKIWLVNYTLLFITVVSFINLKFIKQTLSGIISVGGIILGTLIFLTGGLYMLSDLRESYLEQELSMYYDITSFNIIIRYISYLFLAGLLTTFYFIKKWLVDKKVIGYLFDAVIYISILWVASSELINWMDITEFGQSYKLGLSILWGVYALGAVVMGIWQKKKHIRIGAIALFGVTLAKLFLYDISHLNTIAKTIVFVSLGILLLIISFLYNKYKNTIFDEKND